METNENQKSLRKKLKPKQFALCHTRFFKFDFSLYIKYTLIGLKVVKFVYVAEVYLNEQLS